MRPNDLLPKLRTPSLFLPSNKTPPGWSMTIAPLPPIPSQPNSWAVWKTSPPPHSFKYLSVAKFRFPQFQSTCPSSTSISFLSPVPDKTGANYLALILPSIRLHLI